MTGFFIVHAEHKTIFEIIGIWQDIAFVLMPHDTGPSGMVRLSEVMSSYEVFRDLEDAVKWAKG